MKDNYGNITLHVKFILFSIVVELINEFLPCKHVFELLIITLDNVGF
jgi:hypothetical protein